MSVQTIQTLIEDMRDRTGDNDSNEPFLSDAQWTKALTTSERKLSKYSKFQDEVTIDCDGSYEYDIPTDAKNCNWSEIFVRSGSDNSTRRRLVGYDTHHGKLFLNSSFADGNVISIWIERPYILGADELPDDTLEILYKLCEIEFINHAMIRRADFVQWASLNRSDASINQLVIAKQNLKEELAEYARTMGDGTDVTFLGRY